MTNFWQDSRSRAMRLPLDDLRREAAPASDCMHRCSDCWPCACAAEMERRARWAAGMMLGGNHA